MGPSCVRDAGTPVRGNVLVIGLIGALAVGLSIAASPDWRGAFGAALALLMLAIAVSDIRHFIVPDALSASAFILGLIFAGLFDDALLALMLLYEWWRGRPGLGLGDVKLAAVAGAWLDWFTIVGVIEVAALAALAAYGVWRYVLRRPIVATTPLPFGLFLAPAIWAGWLAEAALARYPF
jgi:leader peptidase (prepilin peptidase)/N-methyltransferase